ncbi:MAG TPA: hypothetical protein HPQ00_09800, partial [Magnetococcales bacterium]|nr:hypothetical protein [Magnetococcales bacterium]
MINKLFLLIFFLVAPVLSAPLQAGPLTPDQTPEPLKPWVDWVLHGKEETRCPRLPGSDATTLCPWPSRLTLNLKETGGRFRQEWQLFAPGWVPLPGGPQIWPQGLTVANKPHPLLARDGQPGVWLPVGQHQLEGNLLWQTMPESLPIPPATALIELTLSGQTVPFPSRDQEGWLWLRTKPIHDGNRPEDEDRMDLTVHRQIVDGVPVTIVTQVEAVVSGKSREVLLDQPLAEGFIPMNITSPLPARMEEDGRLRLQVRPGRWKIHLTHRLTGRGETIGLPHPPGKNWPTEEIWVFQANPSLRLIEPSGLPAVDPQQTSLPMDWRNLPAFLVKSGEAMTLNEKRRGASNLEERRFSMTRSWWLDFDGRGLTVQDRIQGTQQQPRRLEITHPFQLGRVVVAGRDQFITKLPESNFVGVELRDDSLDIIAESRIEDAANTLPVVGWNEDFQSLSGILHLPPGWRIFSVNGADSASPTWVGSWTLLDFFLLLITAMAVAKLWGRSWGFFTVITIALSYHDENALAWILLHILAAVALLRVVPTGRFRRFLEFYRGGAFVALAMVFLPFAVAQVRQGLHPQLEFPESMMTYGSAPPMEIQKVSQEAAATGDEMEEGAALTNRSSKTARYSILSGAPQPIESKKERLLEKIDPNARIQTGPGLPDWNWRKISLNWHGPVTRNQEITFHFLPPAANRFLSFARVLFFTLLLWRVAFPGPGSLPWSWKKMVPIALVFFFLGAPTPAKAADFPNPEMLQELQNRLLAPPDCLPNCTDISRMKIEITSEALRLLVEAHAQETSVLPLPGDFNNWSPKTILLNNLPASALARIPGGHLGLALEKGTHQIVMEGPLPYKERVQISLPVPPHRADLQAQGWSVEGILADGRVQASLLLIRESRKETDKTQETETLHGDPLPAFLNVVRRLHLHQDWSVDTTVTRLTPGNNAVVLRLPLLAGESVTTPGLQVEGGEILLNLPAHATSL